MSRKVTDKRLRKGAGRDLRVLDGGKVLPDRTARPASEQLGKRRQLIPRDELLAVFEDAPTIDYEELRADLDAVADQTPWGWDDWEAWADRHVRRGGAGNDRSREAP